MDEFLDQLPSDDEDPPPSDDEDPPFRITAPSELDDSECDQITELGSDTNPLVNSSGTNLNPDIRVEQQSEPQSLSKLLGPSLQPKLKLHHQRQPQHLNGLSVDRLSVDERDNQELYNAKTLDPALDPALKSLEEKNCDLGTYHHHFIHCADVAGTSLSPLEGAGSSGCPSTRGYTPGTNARAAAAPAGIRLGNNSGDPRSSVKHSPPGKGKAPHEEGARGFADVSGDAIGSMNASREGDLEMGRVNSNAGPSALGDVRSSVVHHVDHTAAGSGVSRPNVATTSIQFATAACGAAPSKFGQASHTASLTMNMAASLLDDTKWKAATPILTKAGSVVGGVGVLADIGKDLPLALFLVAISTALLIIIVAILCAKRPT